MEPDASGQLDVPTEARVVFGDALPAAQIYHDLLAGEGVLRGLIGPREVPRLWDRHLVNCALLAADLAPHESVADVGSGAGLPGIVIALCRPDVQVVLIDPLLRRTQFLAEAVRSLGLGNAEVVRGRAEELTRFRRSFPVVTARAVAPLDRLLAICAPLMARPGRMLAVKGAGAHDELKAARGTLARCSATARVRRLGEGMLAQPTTVIEVCFT
ncbi:MAG: 16S rRNA (guanine(527)-N(7))-methyltransferase RsmG [Sporichthyaceae bacterium]